jgi:8-oxo-dGTP pyrophosphatase MutT (NUDIX family)
VFALQFNREFDGDSDEDGLLESLAVDTFGSKPYPCPW